MPQMSNLLSFIPVPNPELGPRLSSSDAGPRPDGEAHGDAAFRKIAEAALAATGAAGAALAMRQNGEVICMARAGEMAPPLGARLDDTSGISGECLREGVALRVEDTETDTRVDAEACRSLGLRSLAVAAIREGGEIIGILEVFSPEPTSFSERHLEFLRQLAELVVENPETTRLATEGQRVDRAESADEIRPALAASVDPSSTAEFSNGADTIPRKTDSSNASRNAPATQLPGDVNIAAYMAAHEKAQSNVVVRAPKLVLIGLAGFLVACLTLWYFVHRSSVGVSSGITATAPLASPAGPVPTQLNGNTAATTVDVAAPLAAVPADDQPGSKAVRESLTNAASLDRIANAAHRVTKPIQVARQEPAAGAEPEVAPGLSFANGDGKSNETVSSLLNAPVALPQRAPPTSQGVEGGQLETRIAAIYPAQARAVGQQGTVVLDALIGEDGSVRDVRIVSGPPLLRQAAVDAVKRWKYKPYRLNGKVITTQTQVKLDFKLQ